jgi:glycosyltransferase involved in cell wall biosynthesis
MSKRDFEGDRIITISQFAKNEILKFLGYKFPEEKISIVYEGVDREVFKKLDDDEELDKLKRKIVPNSKNNTKIILFVGSEQPRKNFLGVLKACYKVMKETNYDLKIIKIGKAESEVYRKESVKLAEELRMVSNVLFIDYVPEDELVRYYNIADCLVLPTIYEGGFALPILEAMSCECPVVTSNIQPLLELTEGKGAIYINPFNVDEIANAILKILNGQIDIEELTREGSRIAKKYTWERSAEEFYKIYKELQ